MEILVAAIYTDFDTSVMDDSEIEQLYGVLAPPTGDRLLLKFRRGYWAVGLIVVVVSWLDLQTDCRAE